VWFRGCRVRKRFDPQSLRPGGTIAGTTMMAPADLGPYVAIYASIGWAPMAVTTNLSINFLKRPAQKDLLAETRLTKLGKRLAVATSPFARKVRRILSPTRRQPIRFRPRIPSLTVK